MRLGSKARSLTTEQADCTQHSCLSGCSEEYCCPVKKCSSGLMSWHLTTYPTLMCIQLVNNSPSVLLSTKTCLHHLPVHTCLYVAACQQPSAIKIQLWSILQSPTSTFLQGSPRPFPGPTQHPSAAQLTPSFTRTSGKVTQSHGPPIWVG